MTGMVVLERSSDYTIQIESRFGGVESDRWSFYQQLPEGTRTDDALARIEKMNDEHHAYRFRLVGIRIDTVKELLT